MLDSKSDRRGYLTVRQAAELVGMGRDLVYEAIEAGELPHVVIAGVKRLDSMEFVRWLEARNGRA